MMRGIAARNFMVIRDGVTVKGDERKVVSGRRSEV